MVPKRRGTENSRINIILYTQAGGARHGRKTVVHLQPSVLAWKTSSSLTIWSPRKMPSVRKFLELLVNLDLEHPFNVTRFLVYFWLVQLGCKDTPWVIDLITRTNHPWEDCFKFQEPSCESNFTFTVQTTELHWHLDLKSSLYVIEASVGVKRWCK